MKTLEYKERLNSLETDIDNKYYDFSKDKNYNFLNEIDFDKEGIDITNLDELFDRANECDVLHELDMIEIRNSFSGHVYDIYLIGVFDNLIIGADVEDSSRYITYRFSDIAEIRSKLILLGNIENFI